jgi:hypothetical protein
MVTPVEEPQEEQDEQDDVAVPAINVEAISSTSKKPDTKFDFAVEETDRPGLTVYTVSTKPAEAELKTLTILAPSYGAALEMAGINKGNTVKVSETLFEG